MTVIQPGTIQAFEMTPIYSRIAGYVQKYRYNIGDRVKAGDVLHRYVDSRPGRADSRPEGRPP